MTSQRSTILARVVCGFDGVCIIGAICSTSLSIISQVQLACLAVPLWLVTLALQGAYRSLRKRRLGSLLWTVLKSHVLSTIMLGCMLFLLRLPQLRPSVFMHFVGMSCALLILRCIVTILAVRLASRRGHMRHRMLVVGTGPPAQHFMRAVHMQSRTTSDIVGAVGEDPALVGTYVESAPVLGVLEQLPQLLDTLALDEVAFVVPRSCLMRLEDILARCERAGITATVATDLLSVRLTRATPAQMADIPLVTFEARSHAAWRFALKRVMDIALAAGGLMACAPALCGAALLAQWSSRGPVWVRQICCGLNGQQFTRYRLRTMRWHGCAGIPQLWNVLRGEMSVVGPPPPTPKEVFGYEPWQQRRLSMRPGLTCLHRLRAHGEDATMETDLMYIDQWSLLLDLKILLRSLADRAIASVRRRHIASPPMAPAYVMDASSEPG